jgi:hypothetical protein
MSTAADIRIDTRRMCIMLNDIVSKNTCATESIKCRQLGSDFCNLSCCLELDTRLVKFKDTTGETVLHICVNLGFVKTAALLLFLGADVYVTNARGVSPVSTLDIHNTYVSLSKNQESIHLLLQKSTTLITITSALSCRVGKKSSLKLLPIELIRLLNVMLFKPVTEFKRL